MCTLILKKNHLGPVRALVIKAPLAKPEFNFWDSFGIRRESSLPQLVP